MDQKDDIVGGVKYQCWNQSSKEETVKTVGYSGTITPSSGSLLQRWKNTKNYFSKEYSNHRKHQSIKAKQADFGGANQATEKGETNDDQDFTKFTKDILQQLKSFESSEL